MSDWFVKKFPKIPKNRRCECCGRKEELTVDHKTPKSKGGDDSRSNIGILCKRCNQAKGNKIMDYNQLYQYVKLLERNAKL